MTSSCVLDLPPVSEDADGSMTGPGNPTLVGPDPDPEPEMEPEPPLPDGGGGASGGSGGRAPMPDASAGQGGAGNGGGGMVGLDGGGGAMEPSCDDDQRECNGACVAMDEPCCVTDCNELANATGECVSDECVIVQCDENFVDCDGEAENGCEADFSYEAPPAVSLPVPPFNVMALEPWVDLPVYPIVAPCADCLQGESRVPHPDSSNQGGRTAAEGLAVFSLGWDAQALHLRVRVFDDDITTEAGDLGLLARAYDNIEFVFDGDMTEPNGSNGRLIFVGFDGALHELDSKPDQDLVVDVDPPIIEASCFTVTAHFTRSFLSESSPPTVTLEAGAAFQFDVGINDYDGEPSAEEPETPFEHTAHLFFRDPGANYWFGIRPDLPRMELAP